MWNFKNFLKNLFNVLEKTVQSTEFIWDGRVWRNIGIFF